MVVRSHGDQWQKIAPIYAYMESDGSAVSTFPTNLILFDGNVKRAMHPMSQMHGYTSDTADHHCFFKTLLGEYHRIILYSVRTPSVFEITADMSDSVKQKKTILCTLL
jgi:hypothetical protein